jgi:predicted nucleic acid-binding Zn ribbon protein
MPHSKGFRYRKDERTLHETPIGEVVDDLLKERAFARGVPIGQLASGWADVVGPRLAAESAPLTLEGGVLVVAATTGPWGAQVRFLADQIRIRAEEALGAGSVATVRVVIRPDPRKGL